MEQPYLKKFYIETIAPELKKKFGYENVHQVPKVSKIVINSGFDASKDKNFIADLQKDLTSITGQHAVITKAKKSVSNFKLREGMPIGCMVTLRGGRMYDFLLRLVAISLPAIRDFRGVNSKLDGNGNYNLGISDHTIFPEITGDTGSRGNIGMDITIVTTASNDEEGRELLRQLGMPFRKSTPAAEQPAEAVA